LSDSNSFSLKPVWRLITSLNYIKTDQPIIDADQEESYSSLIVLSYAEISDFLLTWHNFCVSL